MRGLIARWFPVGTRSVLFGAHAFWLHPFFVAAAWRKLYGFPFDPRLWAGFFLHDIGYWSKPNMDGPEGESHPELGARIMRELFDCRNRWSHDCDRECSHRWYDFCLYHSRYYAKARGAKPSRLCFADKLAFALTPAWIYLPMVTLTGEINEYLASAQTTESGHWTPTGFDKKKWHAQLCIYMRKWVAEHLDGSEDTWVKVRHEGKA